VISILASPALLQFLDEPEAFLHPPHARLMGQLIPQIKPIKRQIFIATHSGDLLRGLLDASAKNLRVIRIAREDEVNHANVLEVAQIEQLWADPILRFSNVLDGLFHESVVVTEADSDCRLYAAMGGAIADQLPTRDLMFIAAGGKQRIPVVVRSLRSLGVHTRAIADFDVLREENDVSGIVAALGGDWSIIKKSWRIVKHAIEQKSPPLSIGQVREQITSKLDQLRGPDLPEQDSTEIREIPKRTSPWQAAKLAGIAAVPSGDASGALNDLIQELQAVGLFLVPCGEIERFVPSIGLHGPAFVAKALERDLPVDPELKALREFIASILRRAN
jgi:hypothetical protein